MIQLILIIYLIEVSFAKSVASTNEITECKSDGVLTIDGYYNPNGNIYSPGYKEGENYPNNAYCEYVVLVPEGYLVKLTFIDFDVEPGGGCARDFLEVRSGDTMFGTFCGNISIPAILSTKNELLLRFMTDDIGTRRGFKLQYDTSNTLKSLCKEGEKACRNRLCYPSEKKCDGIDDCGDGTDEEKCDYPLPVTGCGIREISEAAGPDRVIGGQEAIPFSWPWQVSLHENSRYLNGQICGGTLINAQWVLTAAHCIGGEGRNPAHWRAHVGKHHSFKIDKSEQIRYVERIIVYPGTTGEELLHKEGDADLTNDYTLMKLNAPVKFTKEVRTACLPEQGFELTPGKKCWGTGWGMTRGTGADFALKELDLTVLDGRKCKLGSLSTRICTKNDKGFQDLCHGDSGGPFVCEFDGKWYINGLTSFGTAGNSDGAGLCAMQENFAVFAKVSQRADWIKEQIDKYS